MIDRYSYMTGMIHKKIKRGLALCYKMSKVNIIEVIDITSAIEVLPIVLEI